MTYCISSTRQSMTVTPVSVLYVVKSQTLNIITMSNDEAELQYMLHELHPLSPSPSSPLIPSSLCLYQSIYCMLSHWPAVRSLPWTLCHQDLTYFIFKYSNYQEWRLNVLLPRQLQVKKVMFSPLSVCLLIAGILRISVIMLVGCVCHSVCLSVCLFVCLFTL